MLTLKTRLRKNTYLKIKNLLVFDTEVSSS